MRFRNVDGNADLAHIQNSAVVLDPGSAIFSHDYPLKSITAVMHTGAPSGHHTSALRAPVRLSQRIAAAAMRSRR